MIFLFSLYPKHPVYPVQKKGNFYTIKLKSEAGLDLRLKSFLLATTIGIPQDRIAKRLGLPQKTISNHLAKMPVLAIILNTDLSKGFTVPHVAEKHGWTEPMVCKAGRP